jgi:hypothetical protein
MYQKLIYRNKSIAGLFGSNVDCIIFHEGNVPDDHQSYIQYYTPELKIKWIQVPLYFPQIQVPEETMRTFYDGSCYPGYHAMCNFHMCDVWNYLKGYEVIFRVDEDCVLHGTNWSGIFETVSPEVPYKTVMFDVETHELTNKTLPGWLGPDAKYYDESMPYTNVFVSRTDVWFRPEVQEWIEKLKQSHGCFAYRWGDAPLHGVALKKFGIASELLKGFEYYHGSHDRLVK